MDCTAALTGIANVPPNEGDTIPCTELLWEPEDGFPSDTLGGLITGLNALFSFTAWIMLDGKANIPAFALGGTLLGVGGRDGDCGTNAAPLRKPGEEGIAMLCRVIDGGRLVENPLMPFAALDIEITVPGATWTSEFGGDTTCPASVGNELLCG